MSLGTYYSNGGSARSTIIEDVIDYFKLDVEVKLKSDTPNYTDLFPLGKTPAFITSDGVKFHELLAVLPYVLKLAGKEGEGLLGKTEIEKTLVMSFLSFINTDLMSAAVKPYLVSIGYISYDEAVISQALKDSYSYLKYLDDILAKSKYFTNSEAPNMADFYFVKFLCMLSNDLYSEECAAKFPHVNNLIQDVANNFELSKKVKGTKPTPNKLSFDAISK